MEKMACFFTEDVVREADPVECAEKEVNLAEAVVENFTDVEVVVALVLDLADVDVDVDEVPILVDVVLTTLSTDALTLDACVTWAKVEEANEEESPHVPNSDWQPVPQYASVDPQNPFALEEILVATIARRLHGKITCSSFQKSTLGM